MKQTHPTTEVTETKDTNRTYNLVLEYFKEQIVAGQLKLGDKLPSERTLMAELGLSRNSVREALRQMENMGFVRSVHGQGSFLVNEAGQGFSQIFSMLLLLQQTNRLEFMTLRFSLEMAAFEQAVTNPNPHIIQRLRGALQSMEQATQRQQLEQAEKEFHRALIDAGQNQLFGMIMDALASLGDTYRKEILAYLDPEVQASLLQTHRDIVAALEEKDAPKGRKALQQHFGLIQSC